MTVRVSTACLLVTLTLGASCSSNPARPSAVTVAGTWSGTLVLTSASGGECIGEGVPGLVGVSSPFMFTVAQADHRLTMPGSCPYAGSVDGATFTLTADPTNCPIERNVICGTGAERDLRIVSSTLSGTVT